MMNECLLEIDNLSVKYEADTVLNQVCFQVATGEFVSIIGPNGAGKTTLIKCILRAIKGWKGAIRVAGKNIEEYRQSDLARIVSYVPQFISLEFPYTVYEFVMMARYPYRGPFANILKKDHEIIEHALTITDTSSFADRPFNSLSGGEFQRVNIAAAIAQQSKMVILDEPTSFLDPKHQMDVVHILKNLKKNYNTTILLVTHDINFAVSNAQKILALKKGVKKYFGDVDKFLIKETLSEIYDQQFDLLKHNNLNIPYIVPRP